MHPYNALREHHVERSRAGKLTGQTPVVTAHKQMKGYAAGGSVPSQKVPAKNWTSMRDAQAVSGRPPRERADKPRFARGGKVKKHSKVNVNVIVPHGPAPLPAAPPMAPAPVPAPAMAARPMPPMPGPMPPPGAGPGMPMRPGMAARGGRTYAKGGAVLPKGFRDGVRAGTKVQHTNNKFDGDDVGRGKVVTYARGGGVADSGNRGVADLVSEPEAAQQARENAAHRLSKGVLRKTGGRIDPPVKGGMAPHLPGGAGGGLARLAKAKKVTKGGMAP